MNTTKIRTAKIKRSTTQWKLHQEFKKFVDALNRVPDAREILQNRPKSAPAELVNMVF